MLALGIVMAGVASILVIVMACLKVASDDDDMHGLG